jgi:hypothetical protein
MSSLTLAYITAREEPHSEWFFSSLRHQLGENDPLPKVMVVDRLFDPINRFPHGAGYVGPMQRTAPKPTVWQGPHRLTKEDWFAMANARNTALCLCDTDWIAYVDDLSVLMPAWLGCVKEAISGSYNVAGAYRKVKQLVVEEGIVKSFIPYSDDVRIRLSMGYKVPCDCDGGWLYGCSCAFRVEDLLAVGGWPEICDGIGSEDYCLGIALKNAGKPLMYDRRMMTFEAEDLHGIGTPLRRTDKGISPNDKSHALLGIARSSVYYPNYFPSGGIKAERERVLSGKHFTLVQIPDRDWYDGQLLAEM